MASEKIKVTFRFINREDLADALQAAISADKYYREAMTQEKTVTFGKFKCHETDKGTIVVTYAKN